MPCTAASACHSEGRWIVSNDNFEQYEIVAPPTGAGSTPSEGEGESLKCYVFLPKFRETRGSRPKVWKTDGTPYVSPNGALVAYIWSHPRGDRDAPQWNGYVPYDAIRVIPNHRSPNYFRGVTPPSGGGSGPRKCSICHKADCRIFHEGLK